MENNQDLQIENGNYTRIANKILDELVKTPLLGAELSICLFVIRKTYGYSKTQDQISLSQFEEGIQRSRPTIIKSLKNLQLVNILQLVKVGDSKMSSSVWKFNKYYKTWKLVKTPQLVNTPQLVKDRTPTSKEKLKKLVKTPLHTKDNTKDNTKEILAKVPAGTLRGEEWQEILDAFEPVNKFYVRFYKNKTQRQAIMDILKKSTKQQLLSVIKLLPQTNRKNFFPHIDTPIQLRDKWSALEDAFVRYKQKGADSVRVDTQTVDKFPTK